MPDITKQQRQILARLIYPESFEDILDETELHRGALRDELIQLVNSGHVTVASSDDKESSIPFYDSDNMHLFAFQATKSGLKQIR